MNNRYIQDSKKKALERFEAFENLVERGGEYGLSIEGVKDKLLSAKETIKSGKIKVALVGGFSEGKTTLAASWLGYLEENMKIDPDESSDEIQIYHPKGLEEDCEIIDTPGLYGGKSLADGTEFKDLTLKYVSEAHLILFVLDPVNPIKDSHAETVKWLFRDLKKINSVIFVINKMDEVADLTDAEDFEEIFNIKKKVIAESLGRLIDLSLKEKEELLITAVAANPKGKGLDFWFNRNEDYVQRSRIDNLRQLTNEVLSKSKDSLMKSANISVVKDILINHNKAVSPILHNLALSIETSKESLSNIKNDYDLTLKQINGMKASLKEELISYKNGLLLSFNAADLTTFSDLVLEEIGEEAINFQSRVISIVERYANEVSGLSNSLNKSFESEVDFAQNLLEKHNSLIKGGLKGLKAIPVGQWHTIINSSRNFLNSTLGTSIKFKPWGITKLAKGASGAMAGIAVAIEAWETISTIRRNNKLEKAKKEIALIINETINGQLEVINDQDTFMKTFAPDLSSLKEQIDLIIDAYEGAIENKNTIESWIKSVNEFSFENIEDVSFEEV